MRPCDVDFGSNTSNSVLYIHSIPSIRIPSVNIAKGSLRGSLYLRRDVY
jgi:hypothetical protein